MLARIGTHDLSSISGNLIYDARDPNTINLVPVGSGPNLVSAKDFYDRACRFANRQSGTNGETQFLDDQRLVLIFFVKTQ